MTTISIANQLSHIILGYLDEKETAKRKRELPISRIIKDFAIHLLSHNVSFLQYSTQISSSEFNSTPLTSYLTPTQRATINRNLEGITSEEVNDFVLQLQSKGGIAKLAKHDDAYSYSTRPRFAMIAHLKRGDVTASQVASICLLNQAIDQLISHQKTVVTYWDQIGSISDIQIMIPIPFSCSYTPHLDSYSLFEDKRDLVKRFFKFSDDEFEEFIKEMSTSPDSEQHFHTIKLPAGAIISWSPLYHRMLTVFKEMPEPLKESEGAVHYRDLDPQLMVVPSFTMLKKCLKIRYRKNAISLLPLIGKCTLETIKEFKFQNIRVLQVGMPEADTPEMADNYYCGKFIFSIHHFFHAALDSSVKVTERQAINEIVTRIFAPLKSQKTKDIIRKLMNGEFYLSNREGKFGHLFSSKSIPWDEDHKRIIIRDMVDLPSFWKREFNLTREDLSEKEQELYDSIKTSEQEKRKAESRLFDYYDRQKWKYDPLIQFRLGQFYFTGEGIEESYKKAISHWKIVSTHPKTDFMLYQRISNHMKKVIHEFVQAACQGDLTSLLNLGDIYLYGLGVKKDLKQSERYFTDYELVRS